MFMSTELSLVKLGYGWCQSFLGQSFADGWAAPSHLCCGCGTPNHTFWSRKVKQEKSEGAESSPDWAPYRNNYGCYFEELFNNVQQMTSWDYNTATSTLLGAFSSLLPPHSQCWYICIFPRQLSCSKGSGASWELPCTRREGLSSSPGVYLEFAQQQHLHCHPVQEDILGQIRAASGAEFTPQVPPCTCGAAACGESLLSQLSYL